MPSVSAQLLGHINAIRDPSDSFIADISKTLFTQGAYVVMIPFSLIETAIGHFGKASAGCLPLDPNSYQSIEAWANNSALASLWAAHSFAVNLFSHNLLISTEAQFARSYFYHNPYRTTLLFIEQQCDRALGALEWAIEGAYAHFEELSNYIGGALYEFINEGVDGAQYENPFTGRGAERFKPPAVSKEVATILQDYELGDNARAINDFFERMVEHIPMPDANTIDLVGTALDELFPGISKHKEPGDEGSIHKFMRETFAEIDKLRKKTSQTSRDKENISDNIKLLKMMTALYGHYNETEDENEKLEIEIGFEEAFEGCITRKFQDFERFFCGVVEPRLNPEYTKNISPVQALICDLMRLRRALRDTILHQFFIGEYDSVHVTNTACMNLCQYFHLPQTGMLHDYHARAFITLSERDKRIIAAFQTIYTKEMIYVHFHRMIHRKAAEKYDYRYENDDFFEYVAKQGLDPDNATDRLQLWENGVEGRYHPRLLIGYLAEQGVYKHK